MTLFICNLPDFLVDFPEFQGLDEGILRAAFQSALAEIDLNFYPSVQHKRAVYLLTAHKITAVMSELKRNVAVEKANTLQIDITDRGNVFYTAYSQELRLLRHRHSLPSQVF